MLRLKVRSHLLLSAAVLSLLALEELQAQTTQPAQPHKLCFTWRALTSSHVPKDAYDPLPELLALKESETRRRLWLERSSQLTPQRAPKGRDELSFESGLESGLSFISDEPLDLMSPPERLLYVHGERSPCLEGATHAPQTLTAHLNTLHLWSSHPALLWVNGEPSALHVSSPHRAHSSLPSTLHSLTLRFSPFVGAPHWALRLGEPPLSPR